MSKMALKRGRARPGTADHILGKGLCEPMCWESVTCILPHTEAPGSRGRCDCTGGYLKAAVEEAQTQPRWLGGGTGSRSLPFRGQPVGGSADRGTAGLGGAAGPRAGGRGAGQDPAPCGGRWAPSRDRCWHPQHRRPPTRPRCCRELSCTPCSAAPATPPFSLPCNHHWLCWCGQSHGLCPHRPSQTRLLLAQPSAPHGAPHTLLPPQSEGWGPGPGLSTHLVVLLLRMLPAWP